MINTIEWIDGKVRLIDQTLLPGREVYVECDNYQQVAEAITSMKIRGAPAIGVAAAMGVALGARQIQAADKEGFLRQFEQICKQMAQTRPTAVNLFWAIEQMKKIVAQSNGSESLEKIKAALTSRAKAIWSEDIEINKRMGQHGKQFIKDGDTILTHCNAGALATAGYGTALGVIRAAHEEGKRLKVLADETRPFLQGARLTCWELQHDGIPVTLISDNMAGYFMQQGQVDLVIVGADRIAANGDVANKIGTYTVAVLAKEHNIPFYVAAPISTLDLTLSDGKQIPIEQRSSREVTCIGQHQIAPVGVSAAHPAFDVTPNKYVTAIITERGVSRQPHQQNLSRLFKL